MVVMKCLATRFVALICGSCLVLLTITTMIGFLPTTATGLSWNPPSASSSSSSSSSSFRTSRNPHLLHSSLLYSKADTNDRDEEIELEYALSERDREHHYEPPASIKHISTAAGNSQQLQQRALLSTLVTLLTETHRKMDRQQEKMDRLIQLMEAQQVGQVANKHSVGGTTTRSSSSPMSTSSTPTSATATTTKTMLFIDGTWLYYSIYERESEACPFQRQFGPTWTLRYDIDWSALLTVLSETLGGVPISRASVFTSYKAATSPNSFRFKMFADLKNAGYDVHMMETVGRSEKCVDIQLATELLHASCDIAVLLTGDKDFLPAMVRARKQKKLALVSMRRSCNKALYETSTLDYDVIWLDDYVERLVVPKDVHISVFTIAKVLVDFIQESGVDSVNSRDVGHYLKYLRVDSISLSDQVKLFGGLKPFLTVLSNIFFVEDDSIVKYDPNDQSYLIGLRPKAEEELMVEAKQTTLSAAEKKFFDQTYSLKPLQDKLRAYGYTLLFQEQQIQQQGVSPHQRQPDLDNDAAVLELPEELTRDYSLCTVSQLKERCRERGLLVSGVKSALLERVETDVTEQVEELLGKTRSKQQKVQSLLQPQQPPSPPSQRLVHLVPEETAEYLEGLVVEYVKARGGNAGSRDLGRYLAANSPFVSGGGDSSALQELKTNYGSLMKFIQCSETLEASDSVSKVNGLYEFSVLLKNQG